MTDRTDRIPYDVTTRLETPLAGLAASLRQWEHGDDSKAYVRRAANRAMDSIDLMLAELYAMRARLSSEIRESDTAAAVRADRLLEGDG